MNFTLLTILYILFPQIYWWNQVFYFTVKLISFKRFSLLSNDTPSMKLRVTFINSTMFSTFSFTISRKIPLQLLNWNCNGKYVHLTKKITMCSSSRQIQIKIYPSISYIRSQSGVIWHSLYCASFPVNWWSLLLGFSFSPAANFLIISAMRFML